MKYNADNLLDPLDICKNLFYYDQLPNSYGVLPCGHPTNRCKKAVCIQYTHGYYPHCKTLSAHFDTCDGVNGHGCKLLSSINNCKLGFKVKLRKDIPKEESMNEEVKTFGEKLEKMNSDTSSGLEECRKKLIDNYESKLIDRLQEEENNPHINNVPSNPEKDELADSVKNLIKDGLIHCGDKLRIEKEPVYYCYEVQDNCVVEFDKDQCLSKCMHYQKTQEKLVEKSKIDYQKDSNKDVDTHKLMDGGTRKTFDSGAKKEDVPNKPRFDLIPPTPIRRLALHYARGAEKYEDRNWEKGIPASVLMNSAMSHINKYMAGETDEDHLVAAVWNLIAVMHFEDVKPSMIDIPNRLDPVNNMIQLANGQPSYFNNSYDVDSPEKVEATIKKIFGK